MPKGIPGPITWQVGRGLRIVAAHGPATGCAPRDFAGCEERGRGGRAAPSELAKRASSPPCRDGATSACTRMSTERTQWPARKRQQRTTGRIVLMQTSTAIQKGYSPDRCMHPPGKHPFCPVELTGPKHGCYKFTPKARRSVRHWLPRPCESGRRSKRTSVS